MDYSSLIIILAYIAAFQGVTKFNFPPLLAAFIAIGIPYAIKVIGGILFAQAYNSPVFGVVISWAALIDFTLQLAVAYFVFKKVQDEDTLSSVFLWGIAGLVLIVFIIPFLIARFITF